MAIPPNLYCPLCGCPFEYHSVYDPSTGWARVEGAWLDVLKKAQWLEKYRLIGRSISLLDFALDALESENTPQNHSTIPGLFISSPATLSPGEDGYIFRVPNTSTSASATSTDLRVFNSNARGDVLFPVHDACLEIAERVVAYQDRNRSSSTMCNSNSNSNSKSISMGITIERVYEGLCKQHAENMRKSGHQEFCSVGLEWSHNYYGADTLQSVLGWTLEDGDEEYCSDPIAVPNITTFILSLLPTNPTPASLAPPPPLPTLQNLHIADPKLLQPSPSSTSTSRRDTLPVEIWDHIASYLSISSILCLRMLSRKLAARYYPDQRFWLGRLLSGVLAPRVWDLGRRECFMEERNGNGNGNGNGAVRARNWKELGELLRGRVWKWDVVSRGEALELEKEGIKAPWMGYKNRCRIWMIVESALEVL